MTEQYPNPHTEQEPDEPLFEVRRHFGRTVFIIGNLIQADFTLDDEEMDEAE